MRNGFFPLFTKGRVLKKESIEYLRDYPYDLVTLAYGDHSDGILFGFLIRSSDDESFINISKGALKYQGEIIIVPESTFEMTEYGVFLFAKLVIGKSRETKDSRVRDIELKIGREEARAANEIELGRFCLNSGAILRCEYDSFSDLRTPENTLDLTHIPYAGYGAPTLHPRVMREYAQAVLAYSQDSSDIAFALMCLNADVVHKSAIQWHIAKKTGKAYEEYTLVKLYDRLEELLPRTGIMKRERQRGRGPAIG